MRRRTASESICPSLRHCTGQVSLARECYACLADKHNGLQGSLRARSAPERRVALSLLGSGRDGRSCVLKQLLSRARSTGRPCLINSLVDGGATGRARGVRRPGAGSDRQDRRGHRSGGSRNGSGNEYIAQEAVSEQQLDRSCRRAVARGGPRPQPDAHDLQPRRQQHRRSRRAVARGGPWQQRDAHEPGPPPQQHWRSRRAVARCGPRQQRDAHDPDTLGYNNIGYKGARSLAAALRRSRTSPSHVTTSALKALARSRVRGGPLKRTATSSCKTTASKGASTRRRHCRPSWRQQARSRVARVGCFCGRQGHRGPRTPRHAACLG